VRGMERCRLLSDLDDSYGFKSSFNFVCRDYPIREEVLDQLRNNGFEIGVHGLNHRGNPFRSKKVFMQQAKQVNTYLRQWGAVGFRSPSMYHNLDWIADLDIEYDASTFDVDPFEPQPDGMRTIFPFVVSGQRKGRSYVELPYTLPQDSTLFVFLKQKNIDLWKKKLDWIAEKGGMALLITHPDYMNFGINIL
jgi:peptidoglycan/xylan/chitin deacetylase (PgdA/CDA1 family)